MSKSRYPYPPDEFDEVDQSTRPKEPHAAKRSAWSRIWPFLLVIVLVPAVAIAAVKLLANSDNTTTPPATQAPASPTPTPEPTPTEAPPTPEPTPTEEPTPEPQLTPDFAAVVTVMNDVSGRYTGTKNGLAGRAAQKLAGEGWTNAASSTDHVNNNRETSQVYYSGAEAQVTAEAVAAALGIAAVTEDGAVATAERGIVVSLGDDFRE
ncbi:MAG: LytR C-terminal domain-containing protein [Micrococcales bacterium]|nr:LytR C-terminal domain-containing protein [Micrococcales bacterium]